MVVTVVKQCKIVDQKVSKFFKKLRFNFHSSSVTVCTVIFTEDTLIFTRCAISKDSSKDMAD